MHILTSSNPQPVYTHTPDLELRARYRRWAAAERARRDRLEAPLDRPASRNVPEMVEAILAIDPDAFEARHVA